MNDDGVEMMSPSFDSIDLLRSAYEGLFRYIPRLSIHEAEFYCSTNQAYRQRTWARDFSISLKATVTLSFINPVSRLATIVLTMRG